MIEHRSPVSGVAAYQGRYVATAGYDNQVILWDARSSGRSLARGTHDHLANQCQFSPCGQFLVSASSDYSARVWRVPTMELYALLRGHADDVEMASWSPDGERIATASRDHRVRIFTREGELQLTLEGHRADVLTVEWAPDGRTLLSTGDDGTIRYWSAVEGTALRCVELGGVEADTAVVAGDGTTYVGTDEGTIVLLTERGQRVVNAHAAGIKRLLLSADGTRLLTASYDRTVRVWRCGNATVSLAHEAEVDPRVWLRSAAFLDEATVVFGTFGTSYATLDLRSAQWDLSHVAPTRGFNAVRDTSAGVFTVGDAGTVYRNGVPIAETGSLCNFLCEWAGGVVTGGHLGILFDAETGRALHQHRSPLNCATVVRRADEDLLVVGTYTGEALAFSGSPARATLEHVLPLHDNAVKGLASGCGQLFSVCATGAAASHDVDTLSPLWRERQAHDRIANGAAHLGEGRFASVSRDLRLRIWNGGTSEVIVTPHAHSIKCIAAQAEHGTVLTGSYDGEVALFDVAQRQWLRTERVSAAGVSSVAPERDGEGYLASSYDGRVYAVRP